MRINRVFGNKINFKSLSCAPVNELGVVYLFGVLLIFNSCFTFQKQGFNQINNLAKKKL